MVKSYNLNDKITVSFDADDTAFAHKVLNTLNILNQLEETFTLECKTLEPREVFKLASQTDAAMRKELDALFDIPVCAALFGNTKVYARAGGTPLWFNLIECIINTLTVRVPRKYRNILKKYKGSLQIKSQDPNEENLQAEKSNTTAASTQEELAVSI